MFMFNAIGKAVVVTNASGNPAIRRWQHFEGDWIIAITSVPFTIAMIVIAVQFIRRRRRPAHLCRNCDYDLRASKNACPECGAAIDGVIIDPRTFPEIV